VSELGRGARVPLGLRAKWAMYSGPPQAHPAVCGPAQRGRHRRRAAGRKIWRRRAGRGTRGGLFLVGNQKGEPLGASRSSTLGGLRCVGLALREPRATPEPQSTWPLSLAPENTTHAVEEFVEGCLREVPGDPHASRTGSEIRPQRPTSNSSAIYRRSRTRGTTQGADLSTLSGRV
jgi:hypothetical protein